MAAEISDSFGSEPEQFRTNTPFPGVGITSSLRELKVHSDCSAIMGSPSNP